MRIALLSPGDRQTRLTATGEDGRFADLFTALRAEGHHVEPAIYDEDFSDEVHEQLLGVDLVLVWRNPVHEGRDRSVLDQMLREVADRGVQVSAHPDVVLALGTKQVLYDTRTISWATDTRLYRSFEELLDGLCASLPGGPRVVKQHRGSSGAGVFRVELAGVDTEASAVAGDSTVRVRHAKRGSTDEHLTLREFCQRCEGHLARDGLIVDQQFQQRVAEGMVRCYLVQDRVAGFGHQAVNALIPAAPGQEAPEPGPRLYHPPTLPDFQDLKTQLETEWVPELRQLFGLAADQLPMLWDCDFLFGPQTEAGRDTWVLCEINVSSVAPYPDSAVPAIVDAVAALDGDAAS